MIEVFRLKSILHHLTNSKKQQIQSSFQTSHKSFFMKNVLNKDRVLFTQLGNEGVLYDISNNEYVTLNETYFKILQLVEMGFEQPQIIQSLLEEYEIDSAECEVEVSSVLEEMRNSGYIIALD